MIEGRGVAFGYDRRSVVTGDFHIDRGEAIGLIAPSGGGKTTLLKGLVGLLPPLSGTLVGAGDWKRVGLVFQNPDDQLFALTVREEIGFGLQNLGLGPAEVTERTHESIETVGLAGFADRPLATLSFGERKRVCIAAILAMRPQVLLLDEPTSGLDPCAETLMTRTLLRLKEAGFAIVAASHAVDWIPLWADRLWLIEAGHLQEAPLDALADHPAALRAPYVTQLWRGLGLPGQPLSVDAGLQASCLGFVTSNGLPHGAAAAENSVAVQHMEPRRRDEGAQTGDEVERDQQGGVRTVPPGPL